jgi:indolepyruvate ferredoxin oxidoreductase beta subunit
MTQAISILIGALGGQGGGVLAEWLVDAATQAGYPAQSTSIPGVAQRTGATTYYVEIHPETTATLGTRRPVLGLYPVPGSVDVVVASELLEAGRIVQAGLASRERTLIVTSTSRTLTTAEKMALGDGRYDDQRLIAAAAAHSRHLCAFDMDAAARGAGTVVSAVMLGALARSGVLPIAREMFEAVVRASNVGVEASLRGFSAGWAAGVAAPASAAAITAGFAHAAADIMRLGHARVAEFQDARYGELYLARLRAIDAAERAADPQGLHGAALLRETARFLALWMAFDDVVKVAAQKSSAARFARVRAEVGAQEGDVVRIVDHFKPGMPELAGLLPPALARPLVRFDKRRQARGRDAIAWPLRLRSHTVAGYVVLRALSSLRRVRRYGARYADEQARIEAWLACVARGAAASWELGHEIALCGRLIKGYGATNERGKASLAHILAHLVDTQGSAQERATAVRRAREAALADEGGRALDAELARHGAPPRPVVAQPIRFVSRATRAAQPARVR